MNHDQHTAPLWLDLEKFYNGNLANKAHLDGGGAIASCNDAIRSKRQIKPASG